MVLLFHATCAFRELKNTVAFSIEHYRYQVIEYIVVHLKEHINLGTSTVGAVKTHTQFRVKLANELFKHSESLS